jgi:hypothetical protein
MNQESSKNQTENTTQTSKTTKSRSTRPILGQCSTEKWFRAKHTRPKTLVVTLHRTNSGYTIEEAVVLSMKNQHSCEDIPADVRELARDINRRGLRSR